MTIKIARSVPWPERFWLRVERTESGCWLWRGTVGKKGYGYVYEPASGRDLRVHRVAYELVIGPIPEDLELDHLCSVRSCVNPAHLEPVNHAENIHRGFLRNPQRAYGHNDSGSGGRTRRYFKLFCHSGHKRTTTTIYIRPDGLMECLLCKRAHRLASKYRARQRRKEVTQEYGPKPTKRIGDQGSRGMADLEGRKAQQAASRLRRGDGPHRGDFRRRTRVGRSVRCGVAWDNAASPQPLERAQPDGQGPDARYADGLGRLGSGEGKPPVRGKQSGGMSGTVEMGHLYFTVGAAPKSTGVVER